jgi:hypothetical protein
MAQQQLTPEQANALAGRLVLQSALPMFQPMTSQTYTAAAGNLGAATPTVTINPPLVGLHRGYWVRCDATFVTATVGAAINRTTFNAANLLSQITFIDSVQNTRIQVPGWYLTMLNTIRNRAIVDSALVIDTGIESVVRYGATWTGQNSCPASIADNTASTVVTFWYYVPLAYNSMDLRGSVLAAVTNAQLQLQLSINATPIVSSTADSTLAVFALAGAGTVANARMSAMTIATYIDYLDQLPMGQQGPILPLIDLRTIYELKYTTMTGMVANQDFGYQYPNYKAMLSTIALYFNGTARAGGTDVNYFSLAAANQLNIWKKTPAFLAIEAKAMIGTGLPLGLYYFGSRDRPILTNQYGNMNLNINPITADAGTYLSVGVEMFSTVNDVNISGSLQTS